MSFDQKPSILYKVNKRKKPIELQKKLPVSPGAWFDRQIYLSAGKRTFLIYNKTNVKSFFEIFSVKTERRKILSRIKRVSSNTLAYSEITNSVFFANLKKVDNFVEEHSLQSEKRKFFLLIEPKIIVNSMLLVKKDKFLLIGAANNYVSILNISQKRLMRRVFDFGTHIYCMTITKDESEVVVGGFQSDFVKVFSLKDYIK